jgi:hypothetical protein
MKEFIEYLGEKLNLDKSICVHNYKDFKRTEKGQKMIDTFVERWQRFGFIEGLEGEIRERCAVAMEQLAIYLITEAVEKELSGPFETIGFPMIRRICCGSIGNNVKLNDLDLFNFEKFLKYSKELDVVKLIDEVYNIVNWTHIDAEAEACALGCEMIINRFNGDERSFDDIKAEYISKLKEQIKKRNEGTSSDNTDA